MSKLDQLQHTIEHTTESLFRLWEKFGFYHPRQLVSRKFLSKPLKDIFKPYKGNYQIKENGFAFLNGLKGLFLLPLNASISLVLMPLMWFEHAVSEINHIYKKFSKLFLIATVAFIIIFPILIVSIIIVSILSNLLFRIAQLVSPIKIIPRALITLAKYGFNFQPIEHNANLQEYFNMDEEHLFKTYPEPYTKPDSPAWKVEKALRKLQTTSYRSQYNTPKQAAPEIFVKMYQDYRAKRPTV